MHFISLFAFSVALANAAAVPRDATELDVVLTSVGNTMVKAVITNKNLNAVQLLNKGTILDPGHVEKVSISSDAGTVPFTGMRKRIAYSGLQADAFTPLASGESVELTIDMASVHDLSTGGTFKVSSFGAIPYIEMNSTTLIPNRALVYNSNELEVTVDGAEAAKVAHAFSHIKRTKLQSNTCTSTQRSSMTSALRYCQQLASAAATAAQSGSASKFREYFKTTSSSTRAVVAARLNAVAVECASTTSGKTTSYCEDIYNGCDSGVLAYTLPSTNEVVSCPLYFSALPVLTQQCHAQDQATTTLHEFTHAPAVYSPGTEDNGYGYAAATALSANAALNNADTYALYANGELRPTSIYYKSLTLL
ncbi:uncharacterized protein PV09_05304 [Verruconis gallopava]|uniref:Neutral protease 2 n=1 Tax=Verruconis gallopava TaxID=253628 RepID=A0A0D2A9Z3_9PEZI|nr:uncharacterized protein PV09_05304 [Verruconis gallopava]KIW03543.1 hypothetical protein PV09_05304 [Verruconis gallopava]